MKPGSRPLDGQGLAVGAELEPNPPATHFLVEGGRWWVGARRGVLGQRQAAAMALAEERCSANAHVGSAANENRQKSKTEPRENKPAKCCDSPTAAAAKSA
jgi:hypothetical protein